MLCQNWNYLYPSLVLEKRSGIEGSFLSVVFHSTPKAKTDVFNMFCLCLH